MDELQTGIKIAGRNINNLRYTNDTTFMAESEELKSLLMKLKEESEKVQKKKQKGKWLSDEALQIAEKRREAKGKGEKERYTHLNAEFQTIARRDKKALLNYQCKEIEENNKKEKTR